MNIDLILDVKPIKKRPYKLFTSIPTQLKWKLITCLQLGLYIQSTNQNRKALWLNKDTLTDPFTTSFIDKIINKVARH